MERLSRSHFEHARRAAYSQKGRTRRYLRIRTSLRRKKTTWTPSLGISESRVKARVEAWTDTGDMDAVSALFACLDTDDIDLIVAGAYGHSRWVEGLFGGVSQDLIRQESMAVLLSH